jgi:hypothetical protein
MAMPFAVIWALKSLQGPKEQLRPNEQLEQADPSRGSRGAPPIPEAHGVGVTLLRTAGYPAGSADPIIDHLIDADLCGVESHRIVRALQYHDDFKSGYIRTDATAEVSVGGGSTLSVDGKGSLGIHAMLTAIEADIKAAQLHGIAAVGVRNTGHTGRLGTFAEMAAAALPIYRLWRRRSGPLAHGDTPRWPQGRPADEPLVPWHSGRCAGAGNP